MKFQCPHCNKVLNVKDEFAGKKGHCPGCKGELTVPALTEDASASTCPSCGAVMSPESSVCPHCGLESYVEEPGRKANVKPLILAACGGAAVAAIIVVAAVLLWPGDKKTEGDTPQVVQAPEEPKSTGNEVASTTQGASSPSMPEETPSTAKAESSLASTATKMASVPEDPPLAAPAYAARTASLLKPWAPRHNPDAQNQVVMKNLSTQPVLVRLTGPSREEVNLAAGATSQVATPEGNYRVTARYGIPGSYVYVEGALFKIMAHSYAPDTLAVTTLALPGSAEKSVDWHPITEQKFNTIRVSSTSDPSQVLSDLLMDEVLLKSKTLASGNAQSRIGAFFEKMAHFGQMHQIASFMTDSAQRAATVKQLITVAEAKAGSAEASDQEICKNALYSLSCFEDLRRDVLPVLVTYGRHENENTAKFARKLAEDMQKAAPAQKGTPKTPADGWQWRLEQADFIAKAGKLEEAAGAIDKMIADLRLTGRGAQEALCMKAGYLRLMKHRAGALSALRAALDAAPAGEGADSIRAQIKEAQAAWAGSTDPAETK